MKKSLIIAAVIAMLIVGAAGELTFLAQYAKDVTPQALEAAQQAKLPEGIDANALTQFERELFELGYAIGYDAGYDAMQKKAMEPEAMAYVLNIGTKRFHLPDCRSVTDMLEKNKKEVFCTRDELIEQGYKPCSGCNP